MTFTEVANNVNFLYFIALIVVLLTFIAYKVSSNEPRLSAKKKTHKS